MFGQKIQKTHKRICILNVRPGLGILSIMRYNRILKNIEKSDFLYAQPSCEPIMMKKREKKLDRLYDDSLAKTTKIAKSVARYHLGFTKMAGILAEKGSFGILEHFRILDGGRDFTAKELRDEVAAYIPDNETIRSMDYILR